jgi:hypothetical protein
MLDRTKGLGYTIPCSTYGNRQLKIDILPRKERGSLVKLLQLTCTARQAFWQTA